MFVVFLKFSANRARAKDLMAAHNAWIAKGFEDGVFLTVGSVQPAAGGAIIAGGTNRPELEERINADPFVIEDVVKPEIYEIAVGRTDPRLDFLKPAAR